MYLCMHMADLPGVNQATAQCLLEFEILVIFVCLPIRVNASGGDKCATKKPTSKGPITGSKTSRGKVVQTTWVHICQGHGSYNGNAMTREVRMLDHSPIHTLVLTQRLPHAHNSTQPTHDSHSVNRRPPPIADAWPLTRPPTRPGSPTPPCPPI